MLLRQQDIELLSSDRAQHAVSIRQISIHNNVYCNDDPVHIFSLDSPCDMRKTVKDIIIVFYHGATLRQS